MTRAELNQAIKEQRAVSSHGYDMDGGFTRPGITAVYATPERAADAVGKYTDEMMMSATMWITLATQDEADRLPGWCLDMITAED